MQKENDRITLKSKKEGKWIQEFESDGKVNGNWQSFYIELETRIIDFANCVLRQ